MRTWVAAAAASSLLAGCGSSAQTQPPGKPPTQATVTMSEPGGDAHDPHWAALTRQLEQPWGWRNDKDDQVHAPLVDWEKWKRVRYWGVEHFTGFRYGDDHHVVSIALVLDVPPDSKSNSELCLRRFEAWARPQLKGYDVSLGQFGEHETKWREQPVKIRTVDGWVDTMFSRRHFSGAWAAYAAYPDACLIYAMAVPWRTQPGLAKKVRDRWVAEAFDKMNVLTKTRPFRKE